MPGRAIDRPKAKATILKSLREGATRKASYTAAGIDSATFFRWLDDETFASECVAAEARPEIICAASIVKAAEKDWRAALAWLERRRSMDWKERKEVSLRDLSTEQLLELVRRGEGDPESAGDRLAAGISERTAAGEPHGVPE
jgi:hypothetical protein